MSVDRPFPAIIAVAVATMVAACQPTSVATPPPAPAPTTSAPQAPAAPATATPVRVDAITLPPAAQITSADLATAHAGACNLAVFSEVPAQVGGVERVQTDDASLASFNDAQNGLPGLLGEGRYLKAGADWQRFGFRCLYDASSNQIARFEIVDV